MKKKYLKTRTTLIFDVDSQFMFEKTFYSASRFSSMLELYDKEKSCYYLPLSLGYVMLGLKYYMSNEQLCLDVYSERKLNQEIFEKAEREIRVRLSLDSDDSLFYSQYANDKFLKNVIRRNQGKQKFSMYSLYENLMVSVFLQNTTVQRTISMCQNMLEKYGTLLCFDKIEIYAM